MSLPSITNAALLAELLADPTHLGYQVTGSAPPYSSPLTTAAIGNLLTQPGPAVANPTPQGTVAAPITVAGLLGLLSQASAANIESFPGITQLFADIGAGNRANVGAAVALMSASGRIQPSEATAINTALAATQLDPTWTSTVPGPCRLVAMGYNGFANFSQINTVLGRPAGTP